MGNRPRWKGIRNILVDLNERLGISTVFITHDLSAAYYHGGDIMVMHRGRIVETGDSLTLMQGPMRPYAQLLLQASSSLDPDEGWWGKLVIAALEPVDTKVALRQRRQRCLLAERCPYVMETCWRVRPALFDA
ncbi:MAG: hypothetical protein M3121_08385, partial [Chloroflexota bacterium]|nr:hypothetical protein [Chloroflexota bacterium]